MDNERIQVMIKESLAGQFTTAFKGIVKEVKISDTFTNILISVGEYKVEISPKEFPDLPLDSLQDSVVFAYGKLDVASEKFKGDDGKSVKFTRFKMYADIIGVRSDKGWSVYGVKRKEKAKPELSAAASLPPQSVAAANADLAARAAVPQGTLPPRKPL